MSGDNHGHSSQDGHESDDVKKDIIPIGSWQDKILALVCIATLVGFYFWAKGFLDISQQQHDKPAGQALTHPASAE